MSPTRPRKPQPEKRFTVLAVGEGDTEIALLRHLKRIYLERGKRSIQTENAHGGSPEHVLQAADRLAANAEYDRVVVLLDGDCVEDNEELKKRFGKKDVLVVVPCIEALLLSIFDPTRDWSQWSTADLKSHLHRDFIKEADKLRLDSYEQRAEFSRENMESLRKKLESAPNNPSARLIKILDDLVRLLFE